MSRGSRPAAARLTRRRVRALRLEDHMTLTMTRESVTGVPRVAMTRGGLWALGAACDRREPVCAELSDRNGDLCGRVRRDAGDDVWHAQVGGVLCQSAWRGSPMGCGTGSTVLDAVAAAREDLVRRAAELLDQAARIGEEVGT
jgi:hypothetical protein